MASLALLAAFRLVSELALGVPLSPGLSSEVGASGAPGSGGEQRGGASQDPEAPPEAARRPSRLRDPQGSILVGLTGGASFSSRFTYGAVGLQAGYAVLTGVVPGVRGTVFFGDLTGGELAGTLWLTPPIDFVVVPFAVGEVGYVWRNFDGFSQQGPLYGAGGGIHFGQPGDLFNLRAGLIYRYLDVEPGEGTISPLVVASLRF